MPKRKLLQTSLGTTLAALHMRMRRVCTQLALSHTLQLPTSESELFGKCWPAYSHPLDASDDVRRSEEYGLVHVEI